MACNVRIAEEATDAFARSVEYVAFVLKEPSAANEMMLAFDDFIARVSQVPESYPLCQERRLANLRVHKAHIKKYVALYHIEDKGVNVIAFFHQTQNYAKLI